MISIASPIFPPGTTIVLRLDMNESRSIASRYGKSIPNFIGSLEANHDEALVGSRDVACHEGVRGIDGRHALEVDVGERKLRRDIVHVVVHSSQDVLRGRLGIVAAVCGVAVDLLNPLQIDDRDHSNQQVGMAGCVHAPVHDGPVQTFVEQQIRVLRNVLPWGKRPGRTLVPGRFVLAMHVVPAFSGPALAVLTEEHLDLVEVIALGAEVAERAALRKRLLDLLVHLHSVVAVEAVSLDHAGRDPLASERCARTRS